MLEAAGCEVGRLRDVDDPRLKKTVSFEDPLRSLDQPRTGLQTLSGEMGVPRVVPVLTAGSGHVGHASVLSSYSWPALGDIGIGGNRPGLRWRRYLSIEIEFDSEGAP